MSGFIDRIVARGAALDGVPGVVSLQPRPMMRFESGDLWHGAGAAEIEDVVVAPRGERRAAGVAAEAAARMEVDAPRDAVLPERRSDPVRERSAGEARDPRREAVEPVDAAPPLGPEQPYLDNADVRAAALTPVAVAAAVDAAGHRGDVAGTADAHPASDGMTAPPPAVIDLHMPSVARPVAIVAEPAEAPPPVSISIGRIDVEFVQPAPRTMPTPAARPYGFAAYARARRGEPR